MKHLSLSVPIFLFLLFLSFNTCKAVESDRIIDARAYSMGNTSSVLPGFTNPSSYGFLPSRSLSLGYVSRYGIKELSSFACTVNYPNQYLNGAMYISRYGFDAYNETIVGFNFYKKLSQLISLGMRINYLGVHYSDKESDAGILMGDVGVLMCPADNLNLSFLVINPLRTEIKIGEENTQLANVLTMGISYQPKEMFLLTAEIEKDFALPTIYKFGMEYTPVKELSVRTGMWTKPFTPSFGVGLNLHPFIFNLAFTNHPVLGFQSCCALQFNF
ncbi:hypothetical protein [uncultured Bacteroides sp.]|uniref:hypothetical protein n=1 Tax=uncultured Bacteroides sp. TaxID=162156 RepID=UPI002AAB0C14|nr:hypothetical protein [uncultured Bacteroides sp.]